LPLPPTVPAVAGAMDLRPFSGLILRVELAAGQICMVGMPVVYTDKVHLSCIDARYT